MLVKNLLVDILVFVIFRRHVIFNSVIRGDKDMDRKSYKKVKNMVFNNNNNGLILLDESRLMLVRLMVSKLNLTLNGGKLRRFLGGAWMFSRNYSLSCLIV